ncbi:histidine kinase, partial [Deinococcus sp. 12RED42]|nr:histidine kinase [Deinococcus sp. 12RED42]
MSASLPDEPGLTLPPLPPGLSAASSVAQFAQMLAAYACRATHAHGTRVWVVTDGQPLPVAEEGRGLALSDGTLVSEAMTGGTLLHEGMLAALPFGCGALEFVGADPAALRA